VCLAGLPGRLQFDLIVQVSDPGGLFEIATYTIYVLNSNDPPTFTNYTVNVDIVNVLPGAIVDMVLAVDPDGVCVRRRMPRESWCASLSPASIVCVFATQETLFCTRW
jgi:hypothetical protein